MGKMRTLTECLRYLMQEEESVKTGAGRGIRTPDQRFTKPLRYHYAIPALKTCWWRRRDSNSRPPRCERDALPTELLPPKNKTRILYQNMFAGAIVYFKNVINRSFDFIVMCDIIKNNIFNPILSFFRRKILFRWRITTMITLST